MGRIFGTDGARGVANTEISCDLAMQIGRAAAVVLTAGTSKKARIIIGRDTRISGEMLENALAAGISSVGADVEIIGVVPTPAVAYLVDKYKADAGVMISASHNPAEFNGIKLFSGTGYKLSDALEEEIEALILDNPERIVLKTGAELGRIRHLDNAVSDYAEMLISTVKGDLSGMKIALDCANGSASATAREIFSALKADVLIINETPDGININDGCGSTHMETIASYMKENNCVLGLSFDGDADRCLSIDENGNLVDGDKIIGIFAKHMRSEGTLKDDTAVVTVMSNLGFFHFAKREGLNTAITQVGDRYVLDKMLECGYNLGGEQSGHVILSDYAKTGDGQLTAIHLASIVKQTGKTLSELAVDIETFPQVIVNVKADANMKKMLNSDKEIKELIGKFEKELGDDGRILVRASGTEPLIRVMAEGKNHDDIETAVNAIAELIKSKG